MFEFFFSGTCAFQSLFMLFMSFVCLMFGKLLAENFIYWRLIASRTKGRVVEIREKRGKDNQTYYYPVAEFIGKDGKLHRTTSDIGQNRFPEKEANRTVTVLYFPGKEEKARILGSGWLLFFIGMVFFGSGLWLFYMGLQTFEFNAMTFGMGAALLLYFGWRLSRAIKPREEWETLEEFKERKEREWRRPRDDEQRLSEQDMRRRAQKDSKTLRYASLIMLLGALAFSAACTYVGLSVWELEQNGLRVKGEVIDLDKRSNSDGTTFAPIVRFDTNEGQTITHISLSGSNPPMYQRGDQVEIIYDPANPDLNVMINEGWWNWLLTGILGGFSLIFLLIACSGLMRNTQKL